jgi:hypothetical protein
MVGMSDYRLIAARNYLTASPPSDFRKLLAGVLDVVQDFVDTELDQRVSQVLDEGGVYLCPSDVLRLCTACRTRIDESVTVKT